MGFRTGFLMRNGLGVLFKGVGLSFPPSPEKTLVF